MASMMVGGVRMDWVRRCYCGRKPKITTHYVGTFATEPGFGPFSIRCSHGKFNKDGKMDIDNMVFCRSWSKTRVVQIWRALMKQKEEEAENV